jgi:hypothetical protein
MTDKPDKPATSPRARGGARARGEYHGGDHQR